MASRPRLGLALAVLVVGTACASDRVQLDEQAAGAYGIDLQVVAPRPGASIRNSAGLVEVTGRVGRDWLHGADVVIAIDLSNSALLASGVDLDGDGVVGETYRFAERAGGYEHPWKSWTSDQDDAIVWAELEAARHLIHSLDSPESRIAVLTYTASPRARTLLGSPAEALEAVDAIAVYEDWSGTDVSSALRKSRDLFLAVQHREGPDRPRVIFLLSGGRPTVPNGRHWASRAAIEEARELTERNIAVCVLGFGEDIVSDEPEEDHVAFLDELARTTGCEHIPIHSPEMLRFDRPPRYYAASEFSLRNLTTGRPGRAIRLLRTGLFDGFVELVPGPNTIEVSAVLPDGRRLASQRVVYYEPTDEQSRAEREATARLLLRLRDRATQFHETQRSGDEPQRSEPAAEDRPVPD